MMPARKDTEGMASTGKAVWAGAEVTSVTVNRDQILEEGVMKSIRRCVLLAGMMALMVPAMSSAQLRGLGRIVGTVTDDGGVPLRGVNVRATRDGGVGVIEETSDEKGSWIVNGMARGEWHITFQIPGFVPVAAKVSLEAELARVPPVSIVLKRVPR
jgi:hypothetical protein